MFFGLEPQVMLIHRISNYFTNKRNNTALIRRRCDRALRLESLESRQLLSGNYQEVSDLFTGPAGDDCL